MVSEIELARAKVQWEDVGILRKRGEYQCKAEKLFKAQAMLRSAKARAKKLELPFDLDIYDILYVFPDECPVFKLPFYMYESKVARMSPSLDKIDPDLGYIKGNIQVISHMANAMKQDASKEHLIVFAHWILGE